MISDQCLPKSCYKNGTNKPTDFVSIPTKSQNTPRKIPSTPQLTLSSLNSPQATSLSTSQNTLSSPQATSLSHTPRKNPSSSQPPMSSLSSLRAPQNFKEKSLSSPLPNGKSFTKSTSHVPQCDNTSSHNNVQQTTPRDNPSSTKSTMSNENTPLPIKQSSTNFQRSLKPSTNFTELKYKSKNDSIPIFETYTKKVSLPHIYLQTNHAAEPLCFLVDTGASVSIVKNSSLRETPDLSHEIIKLQGITNTESLVTTLGTFQMVLNLPKDSLNYKFHVTSDDVSLDNYDGIIGSDFFSYFKAKIDYHLKTLLINGQSLPIVYKQPTYIIPARSEAVIECAVSNYSPELYQNNEALVLDHVLCNGVYVSNCIVSIKPNEMVNVSVLNTTDSSVEVKDYCVKLTPLEQKYLTESCKINTLTSSKSDRLNKVLDQIRCSHLNDEEKKSLFECCSQYPDIFHLEGDPLTFTHAIEHSINSGDAPPIHVKSYRFPECHKEEVDTQVRKMLDQNIIRPSVSPWSAPVWVVPKKMDASGKKKWRIVIDYRRLNDVTVSESYPLPLITDILDQLGHSKYFSTLDLASGFHQIKMGSSDAPKTGFTVSTNSSSSGHYEFIRMPFGLKNAPATFQRLMNTALSGLQGLHCYVYLDDCIIYSHDLESHMTKLKLVFNKLREFNLKLQPDKCEFLRREVAYLGHIITDKGVSPNPEKVKSVTDFPTPTNVKQIKSFLGLVGYYRRFIENFSKLTKPLTSLLKKDVPFNWTPEQENSFQILKDKLTTAPLLQYPDFSAPFVITSDASNYAVGAVLSQGDIGKDKPIAYASRTLNKPEGNYSTTEKELLAIIFAVKTFRPYIFGRKFKIVTDHRPLVWLFNVKDPGSRLIRWRLKLEEYDYEIVYKQGRLNSNADALSRCPVNAIDADSLLNSTYEKYFKDQFTNKLPASNTVIEEHSVALPLTKLKSIACPVSLDLDYSLPHCEEILSQLDNSADLINAEREPFTVRSVNSRNKTYYFLYTKVHHYEETKYKDIYNLLIKLRDLLVYDYPETTDFAISDFTDPFSKISYTKIYNMISHIFSNTNIKIHIYKNQMIYPTPVEVPQILKENHDSTIAGHPGSKRMYNRIKAAYYWKGMRSDIEDYVKKCRLCQVNKPLRKSNKAPMEITSTSTRPFERLALDIVGPLPEAGFQNFKFILTLQDDLTKFSSAYPMVSATSDEIARNLVHFMSLFGFPKTILTDLGTCFTSDLFKQLTDILKIKALFTTPYHPQTNGALERSHATMKEYLKSFVNENQNDWHCYLFTAILAYNTTPHCTTEFTPYELLYGYKPVIPNSLYETSSNATYNEYIRALQYRMRYSRDKAISNINASKERSKQYYDAHSRNVTYKTGDMVYLKQHHRLRKALSPVWKGPFKITKVHNKHNVTLQVGRKQIKHHTNEIKPAKS